MNFAEANALSPGYPQGEGLSAAVSVSHSFADERGEPFGSRVGENAKLVIAAYMDHVLPDICIIDQEKRLSNLQPEDWRVIEWIFMGLGWLLVPVKLITGLPLIPVKLLLAVQRPSMNTGLLRRFLWAHRGFFYWGHFFNVNEWYWWDRVRSHGAPRSLMCPFGYPTTIPGMASSLRGGSSPFPDPLRGLVNLSLSFAEAVLGWLGFLPRLLAAAAWLLLMGMVALVILVVFAVALAH